MTIKDMLFDRRVDPRIRRESTFSFRRKEEPSSLAQVVDLSVGGIRFRHVGPEIKKGETVMVQFNLGQHTFTLAGKEVRSSTVDGFTQEVALSFVGIDPKTRKRLQEHLQSWS